jgi:hypothetical protein
MPRTSEAAVSFQAELFGKEITISFTRKTSFFYEPNHGADADGNRGMPATFIDEDYAEDVKIDDRDVTDEERPFVEALITKFLDEHEPEAMNEEPDYPDREDDDVI